MAKKYEIRNSTAEFLIFQTEAKAQGVEVMYADETIWCTQKAMATLFDVGVPAISKHLANVFETKELKEDATVSKMEIVQKEGNREVKRSVVMYSLDAIIAVGYECIAPVCHTWICARQETHGEWNIPWRRLLRAPAGRATKRPCFMPKRSLNGIASCKTVSSVATLIIS